MLAHRVECGILERLLRRVGRSREILDAPCGPGRFFDVVRKHTDKVCFGDISVSMLRIACEQSRGGGASTACVDLRYSCEEIGTFEGVISLRLAHHLHEVAVLRAYLRNVSRLAGRWVIVTFRDAASPRVVSRQWLRRVRGKERLTAHRLEEISAVMGAEGLHLVATEHVSRWFSGHRYALYVRDVAPAKGADAEAAETASGAED